MANRSSGRGGSLLATLLICFSVQTVFVISQEPCMYEYIEQPPVTIDCNPYNDMLMLQCALTAELGSNVSINWYHNSTIQLIEGLEPSSDPNGVIGRETFRSVLTLTINVESLNIGDYHCQAAVGGENLEPSDTYTLPKEDDLIIFRSCEVTDVFYTSATKCADISPTEPVATPTTPPPQPSQTTPPTTTATTSPTLGGTDPPLSTDEDTTSSQNTRSTGAPNVVPQTLQVWIYVLVGVAAVFGIIIVILSIMCVGLCVRRSKTQDSHTLKQTAGGTIGTQSMVSNDLYHSTDNFSAPAPAPPNYQPYSTICNREYETIGLFGQAQADYAHLHRPSPPPLPTTLPNGCTATINGTPPTPNPLKGVPPTLPPKGNVPDTHVYLELEDPLSHTSSPPFSAKMFEQSTDQLLPSNGPFSQANGGPYRKFSLESANESLYSPTTPNFPPTSGLTDIPETGMSFLEPDDPSAFPVHEYEVIPSRKTKKYESPVPDERHMVSEGGHVIGGNPQARASVKSCNYETDPKMDLAESGTGTNVINPYDSTTHIRTTPPLKNNSGYSDLRPPTANSTVPPTHTNSNYSKLNLTEGNYSRLHTRSGTDKMDSDFLKGASEICLSSRNPQNSANGSMTYDSDQNSRENSPRLRGYSVPLTPPPVYPQSSYNQLTLPGFQASRYPPHLGSKTLVQ